MDEIRKAIQTDMEEFLPMAIDLWPDYSREELQDIFSSLYHSSRFNILICHSPIEMKGFIYVGIRTDYVEGSDESPTGYIEGIYVKPAYRKQGIARLLLQEGENWLRNQGCTQVGSDIYIDNTQSYHFHQSVGFKEAGRLIAFIKKL